MDLFEPYGMFLIWFGFLCIFFGLLGVVEIDFGSFIKIFLIFVFLKFFYDFSSVFSEFIRNS